MTVDGASERVDVQLQWVGGLVRSHAPARPAARHDRLPDYPRLCGRLRATASAGLAAAATAGRRDAAGFRPPRRANRFTTAGVQRRAARPGRPRRRRYGSQAGLGPDEFRPVGPARRLGRSRGGVDRRLRAGYLHVRRGGDGRPIIRADADELKRLRERGRLFRAGAAGARPDKVKEPKPRPAR